MEDWKEALLDAQIQTAFALVTSSIKDEKKRKKFDKAIVKFIRTMKPFYPEEFE